MREIGAVGISPVTMKSPMNVDALLAHTNWVRSLSVDLLGDVHQADDVVQQTFMSALEHPEVWGWPTGRVRAWLGRVTRNFAHMAHRGESRRRFREHAVSRGESTPSAEESLELLELQREIASRVMELASPDREIVALRYFDDLTPREIATSLGLAPKTVHVRLHRARRVLREKLDRSYGDSGRSWGLAALGWSRRPLIEVPPAVPLAPVPSLLAGGIAVKALVSVLALALTVLALFYSRRWLDPERSKAVAEVSQSARELVPATRPEATERELLDDRREKSIEERRKVVEAELPVVESTGTEIATPLGAFKGFIEVHVTKSGTDDPAPDIGMMIHPWSKDSWFHNRRGSTDLEGRVLFEALPGSVGVYIERLSSESTFGAETVEVIAGETTVVEFQVVSGSTVTGRVLDQRGAGVAKAEIWLGSGGGGPHSGQVVTRTDPEGRFVIRHVTPAQAIAARATGFTPSIAMMPMLHAADSMNEDGTVTYTLDLLLPDVGGTIEGIVVDAQGRACADAIVLVGNGQSTRHRTQDGKRVSDPPPVTLRTDTEGKFRVEGTETGAVLVRARALGLDQGVTTVNVPRSGLGRARVVLRPAASLAGIVRRADGRPVEGATIALAYSLNPLVRTEAKSDATGRFELSGVPVGTQTFVASFDEEGLETKLEILTNAGQESWWDATFPDTRTLFGELVDASGSPLHGWTVRRRTEAGERGQGNMSQAQVSVDEHGRFRFVSCPDAAQKLEVSAPGQFMTNPVVERTGVMPGTESVLLRVPNEHVPAGSFAGRLVDEDAEPVHGARIRVEARGPAFVFLERRSAQDGAFSIEFLPVSNYRIEITAEGFAPLIIDELAQLEAGEQRELDDLVLEAAD